MKAIEFVERMQAQIPGIEYYYTWNGKTEPKIKVIRNEYKTGILFDIAYGPFLYENIEKFEFSPLTKYHVFAYTGEGESDVMINTQGLEPLGHDEDDSRSEKDALWE